jgi:3-isopropylmalate/(R)-2-methylmalate dehydratase small subunit
MEPFLRHTGIVAPLDRVNVDTDQIIPKQFLKLLTRKGYGKFLFYDWRYDASDQPRPEFLLNQPQYQGASILLARANFGCGSSREHAAWALHDFGVRVVIAPSFADIFYNNCFKNGLLPIALPEAQVDELFRRADATAGYKVTVDLPSQSIRDDQRLDLHFDIEPFRKQVLLEGLDDIGLTLKHAPDIAAYESAHKPELTLYGSVDFSKPPSSR